MCTSFGGISFREETCPRKLVLNENLCVYGTRMYVVGTSEENCSTPKNRIVRKKSKPWTESQLEILMETFQANAHLKGKELHQLAESLSVSEKRVKEWFSGKRRTLARRAMLPESE